MRRCTRFSRHCVPLLILLLLFLLFAGGCSDSSGEKKEEKKPSGPPRDVTPQVLAPQAPGTVVGGTDTIRIDSSCVSDGYVVLVYTGTNEKVKLPMALPARTWLQPGANLLSIPSPEETAPTQYLCWNQFL